VAYTFPSDARFKENVTDDVQGLEFIMKLRPVAYNFNRLSFAKHIKEKTEGRENELNALSQIRSVGFLAQDVEKLIKETGFTSFDAVHAPTNETDNYSLSYAHFVVPLVKAVQQLNDQNKALLQKVDDQQKEINDLKVQQQKISELEQQIKSITAKLGGK
jgi:trimeric autotransporter adhesin